MRMVSQSQSRKNEEKMAAAVIGLETGKVYRYVETKPIAKDRVVGDSETRGLVQVLFQDPARLSQMAQRARKTQPLAELQPKSIAGPLASVGNP